MKEVFKYLGIVLLVFILIRGYDFITKKPEPIDRSPNPEIVLLNQRQDSLVRGATQDHKDAEAAKTIARLTLDSVRIDRKKLSYEHKKLKNTPDSMLQHRMDSILRANGRK